MDLGVISQYFEWNDFESFDEGTKLWTPNAFQGRIDLTDRFLSNFNKPLRRRMLFTDPAVVFPASRTFRDPSTGQVYLLGQSRQDSLGNESYNMLTVCHLVSGLSAGLGQHNRKATAGAGDNLGWLVDSVVGEHYGDLELRSASEESGTKGVYIGSHFLTYPSHADLAKYDFVTLGGRTFKVDEPYYDSGFTSARVTDVGDDRVDFVVSYDVPSTFDYDAGSWTAAATVSRNVTGIISSQFDRREDFGKDASDYLEIAIFQEHMGFSPEPGMVLTFEGKTYEISWVQRDRRDHQWKLRCV